MNALAMSLASVMGLFALIHSCASDKVATKADIFDARVDHLNVDSGSASVFVEAADHDEKASLSIEKREGKALFGAGGCDADYDLSRGILQVKVRATHMGCRQAVYLRLPKAATIAIEGTSGKITIDGMASPRVEVKSTSGNIDFNNGVGEGAGEQVLDLAATSGHLHVHLLALPQASQIKLKTTSGAVTFRAPPESSFNLQQQTRSGQVRGAVALDQDSLRRLIVETTSGNITLQD